MEWTKIPTDLLQSRKSDKEILAITKYQLLWALLERQPEDKIALRYMTSNQLQQALNYATAIQQQVDNDIKTVISNRKRQKLFYEKNQTLNKKPNGYTNEYTNEYTNYQTTNADKIREDKIKEINKEIVIDYDSFMERWNRSAKRHYNMIAINLMTDDRKKKLGARFKDMKKNGREPTIENFFKIIGTAYQNSEFLQGEKTGFNFTLDFVLQAKSFQKLLENGYK